MRLKQIKIVGFKSFVEPTRLLLPSERVGIVGPNGCGKSNTLDAVRWVMGESSAKALRGGDMNDVLFNGTDKRQALSQCSVELVFDNESGQAGGAYQQYSEISVKRVHHREEGTRYFLNQQRCRRRDVLDLFNGTGLGPRSYALIGQGNISRIIESKPEDLRVYIEEVAGIGPYRSRRRETLLRLERTGENLAQLRVLYDALSEQAEHLDIQAQKARDYQQHQQRRKVIEKTVYYHQWQTLHEQLKAHDGALRQAEKHFSHSKLNWDEAQKDYLLKRQALSPLQAQLSQAESDYHCLDKQVDKQLQQQAFNQQQTQQWQAQQELYQQQIEQMQQRLSQLHEMLDDKQLEAEALQDSGYELEEALQTHQEAVFQAQQHKNRQEQLWQKAKRQSQQLEQRLQQAQQEHNQQLQQLKHKQQQLDMAQTHLAQTQHSHVQDQLVELQQQQEPLQQQLAHSRQHCAELQTQLEQAEQQLVQVQHPLQTLEQDLHALRAEQAGLQKLQDRARDQQNQQLEQADQEFLTQADKLIDVLEVDEDWQDAVEAMLGAHVNGVLIAHPWHYSQTLPDLMLGWNPDNQNDGEAYEVSPSLRALGLPLLVDKIHAPSWARYWARHTACLPDDLSAEAVMSYQSRLDDDSVLLDSSGRIYSRYAIFPPSASSHDGLVQRQARLKELGISITEHEQQQIAAQQQWEQARNEVQSYTQKLQTEQQAVDGAQRSVQRISDRIEHLEQEQQRGETLQQEARVQLNRLQEEIRHLEQQAQELGFDVEALQAEVEQAFEQEDEAQALWHEAEQKLQPLQAEQDRVQAQLQRIQQQQQYNEQALQQAQFEQKQLQQQYEHIQAQKRLLSQHRDQAEPFDPEELAQKQAQLAQVQADLQQLKRTVVESQQQLDDAQQQAEICQQANHQADQELVTQQMQLQSTQQQIQALQKNLEAQGWSYRDFNQFEMDTLLEGQELGKLEAELKRIKQHLSRLGAVNMTAIEEYQQVEHKRQHLAEQIEDLEESISSLQQAIQTIDADSRQKLKTTFEQVNQGFQTLFPQLFQGGRAHLSWLDEQQDPLEGGLIVMAQPPGKRNARIQLLSGGEKTLTAIALIFAIFQLKPAPFCILDEVDAPLDDSNVIRFCGLVRTLSEKVQFIFITHNKTTMALAKHLIGVTMHEPGVSRLVSVDLEAAVEMIGESGQ